MIQLIESLPSGTLGFSCSGRLSGEEMQRRVIPSIEGALLEFDHVKVMVVFEPSFEGLSLEAVWDDTNFGLRHWDGLEKLAVVTNLGWVRNGMRALAVLLPCPVHLFSLEEQDNARRWLSEALGTVHLERQGEVITIGLIGQLDRDVYRRIDDDLAQLFSEVDRPRVLLDPRLPPSPPAPGGGEQPALATPGPAVDPALQPGPDPDLHRLRPVGSPGMDLRRLKADLQPEPPCRRSAPWLMGSAA